MSQRYDSLRAWLLQRISAVYLGGYVVTVAIYFMLNPVGDFAAWQAWAAHPFVVITAAGFVLALLVHAWVGLRDVILDYIHPLGLRVVVLTLIAFYLIGNGFWAIRVLIQAGG